MSRTPPARASHILALSGASVIAALACSPALRKSTYSRAGTFANTNRPLSSVMVDGPRVTSRINAASSPKRKTSARRTVVLRTGSPVVEETKRPVIVTLPALAVGTLNAGGGDDGGLLHAPAHMHHSDISRRSRVRPLTKTSMQRRRAAHT